MQQEPLARSRYHIMSERPSSLGMPLRQVAAFSGMLPEEASWLMCWTAGAAAEADSTEWPATSRYRSSTATSEAAKSAVAQRCLQCVAATNARHAMSEGAGGSGTRCTCDPPPAMHTASRKATADIVLPMA